MARKTTISVEKTETIKSVYSKEQIIKSKKYADRRDILNVLLADGKEYTLDDVNTLLDAFMKGKVN